VLFHLDDDLRLVFCDMRQFGRMRIVSALKLTGCSELRDLAPEPLSDDFTLDYLRFTLARSRRTLKQLLLDQTRILGLGNIYAAESLFLARINPFAIVASVSKRRAGRLHDAIREVLEDAIDSGSTLRINLNDGDG